MATLTAANSVLLLSVRSLFTVPQRIQGFATDDAFATEAVEPAEVQMGVDGNMSAGYVPVVTPMTISLQADSASNDFFDTWIASQKAAREIYFGDGVIQLPSLSKSYVMTKGVLTSIQQFAGVRKVMQPRAYRITWESLNVVPL